MSKTSRFVAVIINTKKLDLVELDCFYDENKLVYKWENAVAIDMGHEPCEPVIITYVDLVQVNLHAKKVCKTCH